MSSTIFQTRNLSLNTFCGPESLGEDRGCYQITTLEGFVKLTRRQAIKVALAIIEKEGS